MAISLAHFFLFDSYSLTSDIAFRRLLIAVKREKGVIFEMTLVLGLSFSSLV